jgi:3-dehydroquinate synthase
VSGFQTLTVELGERSYPIHFGSDLSATFGKAVTQAREMGRRIAVITDDTVRAAASGLFNGPLKVGGKTGVNLYAGKNLVGAFHQPRAVYCDTGLLKTLPPREFSAGMAEVIKTGMLADAELFVALENGKRLTPSDEPLPGIVRRCCEIKAAVVKADERETAATGGRALLNLGHTFAHAIEAVAGYGEYLHGEAVGVGLVAAARFSEKLGLIDAGSVKRVHSLVEANGLPVRLREPLSRESLVEAMRRDKKVKHGHLRFVVMESIGRAATRDDIELSKAVGIWSELGAT